MEFKFKVSRDNLYIAAIMFMVGVFTYSMLDYLGTPTVEEIAAWKAKEELEMMEMEMFMKVMGACPTK